MDYRNKNDYYVIEVCTSQISGRVRIDVVQVPEQAWESSDWYDLDQLNRIIQQYPDAILNYRAQEIIQKFNEKWED